MPSALFALRSTAVVCVRYPVSLTAQIILTQTLNTFWFQILLDTTRPMNYKKFVKAFVGLSIAPRKSLPLLAAKQNKLELLFSLVVATCLSASSIPTLRAVACSVLYTTVCNIDRSRIVSCAPSIRPSIIAHLLAVCRYACHIVLDKKSEKSVRTRDRRSD